MQVLGTTSAWLFWSTRNCKMAARLPVTCCPIGNFKITTLPCFPDFRDIISGKGAWMLWLASIIKSPQSAVFSLFPLPCPHPHLPQLLLLLTSELFELYVRYLGHRKYRSVKKYWMTIAWPWLKVMTVALINKKCFFFCTTKWQLLTQSLQNLIATFSSQAYYWNWFWRNWVKNCTLGEFSLKNSIVIFQGQNWLWHISRKVGPIDMKWKGCASFRYWVNYVTLTFDLTHDLDLVFFKVKFQNSWILGIVIWLMWNEKKANQLDTGWTVWSWPLTISMI